MKMDDDMRAAIVLLSNAGGSLLVNPSNALDPNSVSVLKKLDKLAELEYVVKMDAPIGSGWQVEYRLTQLGIEIINIGG